MIEKEYYTKQQIISNFELIKGNVYVLSFKKMFSFIPGQIIGITVDDTISPRLYSIASGVKDNEIRVLYDVLPKGKLTNKLANLKAGENILVSEPMGKFTGDNEAAFWIATGTGIAPFASMFYSGLAENKTLIHGGRTIESFYFHRDFEQMGSNYVRCCSQENAEGVYSGRVTDYLNQLDHLPADYKYYLCGSAEMIIETRDILLAKGVAFDKILAEIYF